MRAIWKGAVSFGLVSIAVRLYAATEEKDVRFHQVHRSDGGRVRYKRICTVDGEEVPYGEIAKGYELDSGEVVVITDEDLADLPLHTSRSIDVLQFVPADQVDPILQAKSYYLEPDKAAVKPYVLLRDALEQSGRVAVVKVALRQREALATLRVLNGVLVMHTMLWPDEVRTPDFEVLTSDVTVRPQELTMATSLVESMAEDFDPTAYSDDYREALQAVIQAKVEGREVVEVPAEAPAATGVVDLMTALRESVERAKQSRTGGAAGSADGAAASGAAAPTAPTAPAAPAAAPAAEPETAEAVSDAPARTARARKAPARKAPAGRAADTPAAQDEAPEAAESAPAAKATAAKTAPSKAAPAKKAAGGTAPAKRTAAKTAPSKAAPAKTTPAKKAAGGTAPAKRTAAKTAPATKTSARTAAAKGGGGTAAAAPPAPVTRRRKTA